MEKLKKPPHAHRTYVLGHALNKGKQRKIVEVLPEFQRACASIQAWQVQRFFAGDGFWNRADPKHIESVLSERYKRSCLNQVVGGLKSWEAITVNEFRTLVSRSGLSPSVKHDLYRINKSKDWFKKNHSLPRVVVGANGKRKLDRLVLDPVPDSTMRLARQLIKHVKKHRNRMPNLSKSRVMKLDATVSHFEKTTNPSGGFDYWLRVSVLEKRKPVWVPLTASAYAETARGHWTGLTQITITRSQQVVVKQVKAFPKEETLKPAKNGSDTLGLDAGLVTLFATSNNELLGRGFYQWLLKVDTQLDALTRNLQRQKIKPNTSKRYKRFQHRIREHAKNEINRILNHVMTTHAPKHLVLEKLDFRDGGLSRRLNRLLTRVGRAVVAAKLEALTEETGVVVTLVPAAYSSQECASCGYAAKNNRRTQNRFKCGFCGNKTHADLNAAHVVRSRRSWNEELQHVGRRKLLTFLDDVFEQRWGLSPVVVRQRLLVGRASSNTTPKSRRASALTVASSEAA